jgi:hypothetical protein
VAKYPEHDPKRDGNRFAWIIEQSKRMRAERQGERRELFNPNERQIMREHDASIEAEEVAHFAILRARRAAKIPPR